MGSLELEHADSRQIKLLWEMPEGAKIEILLSSDVIKFFGGDEYNAHEFFRYGLSYYKDGRVVYGECDVCLSAREIADFLYEEGIMYSPVFIRENQHIFAVLFMKHLFDKVFNDVDRDIYSSDERIREMLYYYTATKIAHDFAKSVVVERVIPQWDKYEIEEMWLNVLRDFIRLHTYRVRYFRPEKRWEDFPISHIYEEVDHDLGRKLYVNLMDSPEDLRFLVIQNNNLGFFIRGIEYGTMEKMFNVVPWNFKISERGRWILPKHAYSLFRVDDEVKKRDEGFFKSYDFRDSAVADRVVEQVVRMSFEDHKKDVGVEYDLF